MTALDELQYDETQKLVFGNGTELAADIQPGVHVFAATTKDKGLQTEVVDLRHFVPGLLSSPEAGTRVVTDVVSFKAELDRYKLDPTASTLWGDENKGRVIAIYNDHVNADDGVDGHGHRDNKLQLQLRPDEDWAAWQKLSGTYYPQQQFGDLIEELLHTVTEPDQADLMEVIDSIRATSSSVFESSIRRDVGTQALEYREDTTASAGRARSLEVPRELTLALRPYEGMETYEVRAWFRLKVSNGVLGLAVKLRPTRGVLRQAWSDVVNEIEEHTGKPVLATTLS